MHATFENLIIENVLIVVRMTLDGETQTDDVIPDYFSENASKLFEPQLEYYTNLTSYVNFLGVGQRISEKNVIGGTLIPTLLSWFRNSM